MTEAGRNIGSVFGKSNKALRDVYQDPLHNILTTTIYKSRQ
jgi:hypothetical protein